MDKLQIAITALEAILRYDTNELLTFPDMQPTGEYQKGVCANIAESALEVIKND